MNLKKEISRRKIEERGATTLKYRIGKIFNLRENIQYNDKSESFDGTIILYSGNPDLKDSLQDDNIQIQIKSTTTYPKNLDKIKVNIEDIKNFQKMGGVIYFQIYLKDDGTEEIYYKVFLPIELKRLIENVTANQKSYKIKFRYLREEKFDNLVRICRDFSNNKRRQMSIKDLKIDANTLLLNGNKMKIFASIDETTKTEDLIGEEFPLYVMCDLANNEFPVAKDIGRLEAIETCPNYDVKIKGKKYYSKYTHIVNAEGDFLVVGKSIKLNNKTKKMTMTLRGNLKERIQDIDFFLDLANNKGKCNFINFEEIPSDDILEEYKKLKGNYVDILSVFKILGIEKDLDIDKLTQKEIEDLHILKLAFVDNKQIPFKTDTPAGFILEMKIDNIKISLNVFKENDSYTVKNSYSDDDIFQYHFRFSNDKDFHKEFTNKFFILKKCNFLCDNFNAKVIMKSFDEMECNDDNLFLANGMLLEMIGAYDVSKNSEIIDCCKYCYEKILSYDHDDNILFKINFWQIKKRLFQLSEKDKDEIKETLKISEEISIRWSLSVLNDEKDESVELFKVMSIEEQEYLKKYPIYSIFEKLIENNK